MTPTHAIDLDSPEPPVKDTFWSLIVNRPPGAVFWTACALSTLMGLWSISVPGVDFFLGMGAFWLLVACAVTWFIRIVEYARARMRGRATGSWWWFALVPLGGAVVLALVYSGAPLALRWSVAQPAFDAIIDDVEPLAGPDSTQDLDVPSTVGTYQIIRAYQQGDAVIFYESTGALFNDAGFAYLPSGPSAELENGGFEGPVFQHLSGHWYRWTASW